MTFTASRPSWRLDEAPTAPRAQRQEAGWVERAGVSFGIERRWLERAKPGQPGVIEQRYLDSDAVQAYVCRLGPTVQLVRRGGSVRTSPKSMPVSGGNTEASWYLSSGTIRKVVMTAWARRQLGEERYDEGVEVAGGLYGRVLGGELVIENVSGRARQSAESSCLIDGDYVDLIAARHRECGRELVGIHHNHPRYRGAQALPSEGDKATWNSWYRHGGEAPFVGLILGPSGSNEARDWLHPVFSAYVANGRGGFDHVPFEVEPEDVPLWRR